MKKLIFSISALLLMAVFGFIAPTGGLQPGDKATPFSLKNVDGKTVSLADYAGKKGVILVFTCNHCPVAKAYEQRIMDLDKQYAPKGFPVVAIQPNDPKEVEEDSYANMVKRAKDKGYTFPYLIDETQNTAHSYGAKATPHVYVLNNTGAGFVVSYVGAIDDNKDDASAAKVHYVQDAVNSILAGKPVAVPQTKAIGCSIKWKAA